MTIADEDAASLVVDLPVERESLVPDVRREVDAALRDLGEDHRYDVLLVVTELVSNVLDHTAGPGRLRVLRGDAPCEVSVEVDDTSSARPRHGRSRLGPHRGKGMVVVGNVSNDWGTRPGPESGKTVFAVIRCGDGATSAAPCEPSDGVHYGV
ncbi:hypothetical protein GCM10011609_33090 [Lentzea pudingi]|uniref:Anti-sigma regulatory factor (Ser/Thr protein kinase) n=1 Tax=Lentzea pudingi TaxID=1789439 RepID=A0ABQ2HZS2_9PSEU|nr:ATP-binding protein [Lentzea pudingi]GGM92984.1 hypothetical protein GCM10011609_33090 [Lentzea pudingi]